MKKNYIPLLLFLLFCTQHLLANRTDSIALVALYHSTQGDDWNNKTNWLSTNPISTWNGIQVDNGRVTGIFLSGNNLKGSLPAAISNLTSLEYLWLIGNDLSDRLPDEIGDLSNLKELVAYSSKIVGSLPPSIGNLHKLEKLILASNQIVGSLPSSIGNLSNLKELDLGNNLLTGQVPPSIGNLSLVQAIYLQNNSLSGGIPTEIEYLTNLEILYLDDNDFTGSIPLGINALSKLVALSLKNNRLIGSIPSSLNNLQDLLILDIQNNRLDGNIPNDLGLLNTLFYLYLNDNLLEGTIPESFGSLSSLRHLYLYNNELKGSIPIEIGDLASVTRIYLHDNNLTGSIPMTLGNLKTVEAITLNNNELSGGIPLSLNGATALKYLILFNNDIDGLPALSNLSNLQILKVQGNQLGFDDLIPNINVVQTNFEYAPQQKLNRPEQHFRIAGNSITMDVSVNGSGLNYQWYKDGVLIPNATSSTYHIPFVLADDAGIYTAHVSHPQVSNLILEREEILLDVFSIVLPIELLSFKASLINTKTKIEWLTASETNSDYFEVERSSDLKEFEKIDRLMAAGESVTTRSYEAIDNTPLVGINYYRLKQVDKDGAVTYSSTVSVNYEPEGLNNTMVFVYPTPATRGQNIQVHIKAKGEIQTQLFDLNGTLKFEKSLSATKDEVLPQLSIPTQQLTPSTYYLLITTEQSTFTKKVIITD